MRRMYLTVCSMAGGVAIFVTACASLQAFGPVAACLANELAQGAIEDPLLLITGCAGATIAALISVIEQALANPSVIVDGGGDSGVASPVASDGGALALASVITNSGGWDRQMYEAHLNRILVRAKTLAASGVK